MTRLTRLQNTRKNKVNSDNIILPSKDTFKIFKEATHSKIYMSYFSDFCSLHVT